MQPLSFDDLEDVSKPITLSMDDLGDVGGDYGGKSEIKPATGRTFGSVVDDAVITGTKGFLSLGEQALGLANMATLGKSGEALDKMGLDTEKVRSFLDSKYSDAQKEANRKVDEAQGFVGTTKAMLENPSTIVNAIGESIPSSMVGGMVLGRGLLAAGSALKYGVPRIVSKYAPQIAGALGEGILAMGSAGENIRKDSPNRTLTPSGYAAAAGTGLGTSAFGVLGGTIAKKAGFNDIDTMLVKMGSNKTPAGIAQRIIGGGITEGLFEEMPQGVQEKIFYNAALDKPLMDGVPENMAQSLMVGAAMGSGAGLISNPSSDRDKAADPFKNIKQNTSGLPMADIDPKRQVVERATTNPDDISLIYGFATKDMTNAKQRAFSNMLNNLEDPESRIKAVDEMEKTIIKSAATPEEGRRRAKIFAEQAFERIDAGEPINIDLGLSEYGAMDDTGKQRFHNDVENGMVESTVASIVTKIQNLQRLKKLTPAQQANIEQYQADLEAIRQYRADQEGAAWESEILAQRAAASQHPPAPTAQDINQSRIGMAEAVESEISNVPEIDQSQWLEKQNEVQADSDYWNKVQSDIEKQRAPKPPIPVTPQSINQDRISMTEAVDKELSDVPNVQSGYASEQAKLDNEQADFNQKLEMMQGEVKNSQSKGVNQEQVNQQGETIAYSSDSPQWMRDLPKDKNGKVYGRKQLNAVFDNVRSGKPLTPAQTVLFDHIQKAANAYTGPSGEMVAQEDADALEKRGFDLLGGRKMEVVNFGQGDRIVATVDGVKDEYLVKDLDENGKVILQDGIEKRVDMSEEIVVEAHKPAEAKPDRRQNTALRKKIDDMSPEEMRIALRQSDATGLKNKRAYDESDKKAVQASIDVDSLKWVNDNMGHEAGNLLLKAVGDAFRNTALAEEAYHVSGDEFVLQADKAEEVEAATRLAQEYLDKNEIIYTSQDGIEHIITGSFSYGTAENLSKADARLQKNKIERELAGNRAGRGEKPPGYRQGESGREVDNQKETTQEVSLSESDLAPVDDQSDGKKSFPEDVKLSSKDTSLGQGQDSQIKYQTAEGYTPDKTIKAYKLFRTIKGKIGDIFPLFIGKNKPTPIGQWLRAEFIPTKGFAQRPGWHAGVLPIAPHLRQKSTGKKAPGRVWAEVEIPADNDWQPVADSSSTRDIRDRVPENGYYKFKTNKMQGGAWIIGGAVKVNRILSDSDIKGILEANGYDKTEIEAELDAKYQVLQPAPESGNIKEVQKQSAADLLKALYQAKQKEKKDARLRMLDKSGRDKVLSQSENTTRRQRLDQAIKRVGGDPGKARITPPSSRKEKTLQKIANIFGYNPVFFKTTDSRTQDVENGHGQNHL